MFFFENFVASFDAFEFDMEEKRNIFQLGLLFDCAESFKNWFSVIIMCRDRVTQ